VFFSRQARRVSDTGMNHNRRSSGDVINVGVILAGKSCTLHALSSNTGQEHTLPPQWPGWYLRADKLFKPHLPTSTSLAHTIVRKRYGVEKTCLTRKKMEKWNNFRISRALHLTE